MATYYVRLDGNDSNSGLGPAANQAWASLDKALGVTGITSGDTLWIAPGDHRRGTTLTVNGTYSSMVFIKGDPTSSQFSGITPGRIIITNRLGSDTSASIAVLNPIIDLNSKNFMTWENLVFEAAYLQRPIFNARVSTNLTFRKCIFWVSGQQQIDVFVVTHAGPVTRNILFTQCMSAGYGAQSFWSDFQNVVPVANYTYNITVDRCLNIGVSVNNGSNHTFGPQGIYIVNSITNISGFNLRGNVVIRNSILANLTAGNSTGTGIAEYTAFWSANFSYAISNSLDDPFVFPGYDGIMERMHQIGSSYPYSWHSTNASMRNGGTSAGTVIPTLAGLPGYSATGTPLTDLFDNPWDGNGTPHIGCVNNYSASSFIGPYLPLERQVESFTISPNTTNRSELIYLGAKGLTHTTPSLSASYVRAGAIRTAITLVSQTPNGSWTSGGFCEIDSTNMPGIYRIDVPNAVFVAGAESAMLQLTGTNQTNGAVVHYNMAKVQFDLSQNVPLSNTAHSIGDALNAARAQGFGKWQIVGNTMNIYAEDGITLVKSFALDSGSYPTQRM
jgi:hypothetical protein